MTATGHAVIGVVIASAVSRPELAIPIALASHVAADLFPHWDPGTNRHAKNHDRFFADAVIDVVASVFITFALVIFLFPKTNLLYAYLIVFASQFLDWLTAPYLFFHIKKPAIFLWAYRFQKLFDNQMDKPWGIIGQVGILAILVILAKLY